MQKMPGTISRMCYPCRSAQVRPAGPPLLAAQALILIESDVCWLKGMCLLLLFACLSQINGCEHTFVSTLVLSCTVKGLPVKSISS